MRRNREDNLTLLTVLVFAKEVFQNRDLGEPWISA